MKQGETRCAAIHAGKVATITEHAQQGKLPRLVILTEAEVSDGAVWPASSLTMYGDSVRKLYDLLREYYGEGGR